MYLSVGSSLKLEMGSRGGMIASCVHQQQSPGLVVRCTQESAGNNDPSKQQAKVPPRKVKPRQKWSRGDGPGEYGGPLLDLTIRPSWGGGSKEDPLTSMDDYIWKKVWQPHVEVPPSERVPPPPPVKEKDSGFLSLNRAIALDRIDIDLSKELMQPSKATLQRQVAAAQRVSAEEAAAKRADNRPKWRFAPTKREEEQWARSTKAASGGTEVLMKDVDKTKVDPVQEAAAARERYLKLKNNLQITTLAVGGASFMGSYFSYSPEIAVSYGVGLLGALAYIRMLGNSVDGLASNSSGGAVRGALGQPRLLVPVVLVMVFNRWNGLAVPQYDVMPLQLIPMLVGFFTYKAATLVETFKELLPIQKEEKSNS